MQNLYYPQLLFITVILFLVGINVLPVIDRDEAHFVQATKQMVETNEYFKIRFQEKTRFQKPPGINWLQALIVKAFPGSIDSIWPYRLASFLGAMLAVLALFYFVRRIYNEQTASIASILLASSSLLVIEAHMAVIDAALLASVVIMQGSLWMMFNNNSRKLYVYLFWLSLTIGFLLKGLTPLLAFLSIGFICLSEKNCHLFKKIHLSLGLCFFLISTLLWVYFVDVAENSNYLLKMFQRDLLPKLQGSHEGHGLPPLSHLLLLPITLWPSSLFLLAGVIYGFKERKNKNILFLWAWILPIWVFFEIMPTKLPQYVLPTFPAICIMMSLGISKVQSRVWHFLWGIITFLLGVMVLAGSKYFLGEFSIVSGLIFVILVLSLLLLMHPSRDKLVYVVLPTFIIYPLIFAFYLPSLTPLWITKNLSETINLKNFSKEKPLLVVGFSEPSLVFYGNTYGVVFSNIESLMLNYHAPNFERALLDKKTFDQYFHEDCNFDKRILRGFNYSKGKWTELVMISKLR